MAEEQQVGAISHHASQNCDILWFVSQLLHLHEAQAAGKNRNAISNQGDGNSNDADAMRCDAMRCDADAMRHNHQFRLPNVVIKSSIITIRRSLFPTCNRTRWCACPLQV